MKLLNISGGATKAIQLAVASIEVYKRWKPDIIAGVSAGAIIALPLALGMFDLLIQESLDIKPDEMFKVRPTNKKGKITLHGWMRAISGVIQTKETDKYSFGIQDTRHFIKNFITEEMFNSYKANKELPDILVLTVNVTYGCPIVYNLKTLNYLQAIEAIEKSCHIPIMTDAIEDEVDGGLWAHCPEWYLLHNNILKPSEVISIYSREEIFKVKKSTKWKENVFENITRTLQLFNIALSTCGQGLAKWYCIANNIKHLQLFCPQVLEETYEFDESKLKNAMNLTLISINEQLEKLWNSTYL